MTRRKGFSVEDGDFRAQWVNERRDGRGRRRFKDGTAAEAICAARCARTGRFIAWVYDNTDGTKGPVGRIIVALRRDTTGLAPLAIVNGDRGVHADHWARPVRLDPSGPSILSFCSECNTDHLIEPRMLATAIANDRSTVRVSDR